MRLLIHLCALFCTIFFSGNIMAQVYSNKVVGKKNVEMADSIKQAEYPYILPIWGEKATALGFDLPLPAGLSVNYLWQESDLIINNLQVGFNSSELYNLDDVIQFNDAISTTNAVNFRPDFWLFPFLNIYGILATSQTSTEVDFTFYVPDGSGYTEVTTIGTKADFDATTAGFGITPTIGVGGGWMAFDMNFSWTSIEALDDPAYSFVFGPRIGKTIQFKKPQQNIAIWAGGFRVKINTGTNGSLPLGDLFDLSGLQVRIDNGYTKLDEAQVKLDDWWNSLSLVDQQKPRNKFIYETGQSSIGRVDQFLGNLELAANGLETSTVQYSLDKKQKNMWNFIVGSQLQLSKQWMVRAEFGFLASRTQFIGGLQYRFGL